MLSSLLNNAYHPSPPHPSPSLPTHATHYLKGRHLIHPIVRKIQDQLFYLSTRQKAVKFCWIPSHVGIPGNENAVALARSTVLSTAHQPRFSYIQASDYYPHFKTFLCNRWQTFWSHLTSNKLQTVKPSISHWSAPQHQNRRWEIAHVQLRIGHVHLTYSQLMSHSNPPLCSSCNIPLTVPHI